MIGESREADEDTIGEKTNAEALSHAKLGRPRFDVQCRILLRRCLGVEYISTQLVFIASKDPIGKCKFRYCNGCWK